MTGACGRISLICDSLSAKRGLKKSAFLHNPCNKINVAVCVPLAGTTTAKKKQHARY
jgi:hypothetical protein